MQKTIGLLLLIAGVSLSALAGARNPESIDARTRAGGRIALLTIQEGGAWSAVCATIPALAPGGEPVPETCDPERPALPATATSGDASLDKKVLVTRDWVRVSRAALHEADVAAAYREFLARADALHKARTQHAEAGEGAPPLDDAPLVRAQEEAWQAVCAAVDEPLENCAGARPAAIDARPAAIWAQPTAEQTAALDAWFGAAAALHEARLERGALATPQPRARLADWFSTAGALFLAGLALIVVGGVLTRRAEKAESTAPEPMKDGAASGPRDLAVVFELLARRARELAEEIGEAQSLETSQREAIKSAIDTLHLDEIEPVVESRARIQVRYGMAGFAAIFGPLSTGERKLNRAWSALVDQHPPEARTSLLEAAEQFDLANAELAALATGQAAAA